MEDNQIIELFFKRDEDVIKEVENKYSHYCLTIAKNILSDYEDCKDCLNEAYFKLWNSIPPERPKNFSSYIGKIVRNLAFNKYNQNNAQKRSNKEFNVVLHELEDIIGDERYNPEKEFNKKELTNCINVFLSNLPKKKRRVFVLRYWYSESIREISEQLLISESNVSVILNRLRAELKDYLKERGFE